MKIKKGTNFWNQTGIKCHVINLFDDDGVQLITYKHWNKYGQRWIYETKQWELFLFNFRYGYKLKK